MRIAQHRDAEAFGLVALCLNLDPQDLEARFALDALYRKNGRLAAADAISGR